jgi:predicted NBD/HSP70 family sugar kinase
MRIGIDLGGTKIEAIALDENGATLLRRRVPTPTGDYVGTLNAIADLVLLSERELCQNGSVGIASPGAISTRTGLLKNSNSAVLNGRPLVSDLSQRLGRPIRLENDANCFALSEAIDGAAAGTHVVFGVILGTGVAAALSLARSLLRETTRSPENGAIIPYHGLPRASGRARRALRQVGMCRDVPVWCRSSARLSQPYR